MNAKRDDLSRLQEIHDIILQTKRQLRALGFTRSRFCDPDNDEDDLIAEGIMNRVLRVTEEVGRLSDEVSQRYGFEKHAVLGVRNRLAHAYGDVDREIIWAVIEHDFDELLASCALYCEDNGLDLE